jgi:hypothetical protein
MANYFVDSTTGDNGDDGTTMDLAWATVEYALTAGSLAAGDIVWVRRGHSEITASGYSANYDGYPNTPIQIVGWPRAADASITQADWTNGSTTVDNIVGLSMDREKHLARFIVAPNGFPYLITKVNDSNTITIDREYSGTTVTGTNGAATIVADELWEDDMGTAYGFDDSGWTIKETAWDADADDLPFLDGQTNNANIGFSSDYNHIFRYIDFLGGSARSITLGAGGTFVFQGCIFHTNGLAAPVYGTSTTTIYDRFVKTTDLTGAGSSWLIQTYYSDLVLKNGALYDCDDSPFVFQQSVGYFENVNVGVEGQIGDNVLYNTAAVINLTGIDVKIDPGVYNMWDENGYAADMSMSFENWGKVLGAHYALNAQGTVIKADVVEGSGDPYKRVGGSDSVVEIQYDATPGVMWQFGNPHPDYLWKPIFTHEFEVDDTPKSYRYYVQAEGAVAADELWMELEYVSSYDDTSEYTITRPVSVDAISARSGADDWSQYLEINNIIPAVASKVRIKLFCRYYHASNKIYVDPQPRVT